MKRNDVLREYKVNSGGRITSPGKFEGEMLYVPAFWEVGLDGFADGDSGGVFSFRLTADDKREFPELGRKRTLRLAETDSGFVVEVS